MKLLVGCALVGCGS
uniref:Uncharacterized protein n=1 Tax=Rhizophora mucronata TaxID=61149 RepID=A0A2P2NC66_RHIMU